MGRSLQPGLYQLEPVPELKATKTSGGETLFYKDEGFKDSYRIALGTTYYHDDNWTFRTGIAFDDSPVPASNRSISIPDQIACGSAPVRLTPLIKMPQSTSVCLICMVSTLNLQKGRIPLNQKVKPGCTARTSTTVSDNVKPQKRVNMMFTLLLSTRRLL